LLYAPYFKYLNCPRLIEKSAHKSGNGIDITIKVLMMASGQVFDMDILYLGNPQLNRILTLHRLR